MILIRWLKKELKNLSNIFLIIKIQEFKNTCILFLMKIYID